jgi:putative nucleotidyltransferase with HDIG domain
MLKILYLGSGEGKKSFFELLADEAIVGDKTSADVCIIEIASAEVLFKLPKKFTIPTYFFVKVRDKKIIENINGFSVAGIFFPPLKKEDVLAKLTGTKVSQPEVKEKRDNDIMRAKVIAKSENIPALPTLAQELMKLSRNDNAQMKDFVEKIKQDQGMSSKIVKIVNSPFYGLRKDVNSIDRATVLLGVSTVKNLALAVSTDLYYAKNFGLYKISGQKLWEHTFAVARICEVLAKHKGVDTDSMYLAGLMHDIGKTVLVDFLVKEVDTCEDEKEQTGLEHSEIGAMILEKWAVAPDIVQAVATHHKKTDVDTDKILYYANLIEDVEGKDEELVAEVAEFVGCTSDTLTSEIKAVLFIPEDDD